MAGKLKAVDLVYAVTGRSAAFQKLQELTSIKLVAGADASGPDVDVDIADSMRSVVAVFSIVTATGYFPTVTVKALLPTADFAIKATDDTKLTLKNTDYSAHTLIVIYNK